MVLHLFPVYSKTSLSATPFSPTDGYFRSNLFISELHSFAHSGFNSSRLGQTSPDLTCMATLFASFIDDDGYSVHTVPRVHPAMVRSRVGRQSRPNTVCVCVCKANVTDCGDLSKFIFEGRRSLNTITNLWWVWAVCKR